MSNGVRSVVKKKKKKLGLITVLLRLLVQTETEKNRLYIGGRTV